FLFQNSQALLERGVLSPFVDQDGCAYLKHRHAGQEGRKPASLTMREPHNALAFGMLAAHRARPIPDFHPPIPTVADMAETISAQITRYRPKTLILASEVFANFAAESPALIDALAEMFPAQKVTLYAVFRPVDDYLVAWHGQRLRFGHKIPPLRTGGAERYFNTIHFDYRRVLAHWSDVFPHAQWIIRPYGDVLAKGGLVADFFDAIRRDPPKATAVTANKSLHPACQELHRRAVEALNGSQLQSLRQRLAEISLSDRLPPASDVEMFGSILREKMRAAFCPVDRCLGQRLGRAVFFPDHALDQTRKLPEGEANRMALETLNEDLSWAKDMGLRRFLTGLRDQFDP
ncbi:MAG: hypothetical protein ACU0A2_05690, partial [Cognatishimia sp.]|uniref:hypothetical protein n=1 Tax=Cognatishimia sp. TaxID=2211648 RepID=UPI0040580365